MIVGGICGMSHFSSPPKRSVEVVNADEFDISGMEMVKVKSSSFTMRPLVDDDKSETSLKLKKKDKAGFEASVIRLSEYLNNRFNLNTTPRMLGICCSGFGGIWGGSQMVPFEYAPLETQGLEFVISFAIGALMITIMLWFIRYLYHVIRLKNAKAAYNELPSFHVRTMFIPGSISGILWSLGNICSIISVTYLGEGIGFSVTQGSMLVSGLWGIFYFQEITKAHAIRMWILFAICCICGIVLLSYNHADAK